MLNLKKNKYYYLLNLRFVFLNYKYLSFINNYNLNLLKLCSDNELNYIKVKSSFIERLFVKCNFINFIKNNHLIIYFNDFNNFSKIIGSLDKNNIFALSLSFHYINNYYLYNFYNYYLFYNKNYILFILYLFSFINKYKIIYFLIIIKIILLLKFYNLSTTINKKNI